MEELRADLPEDCWELIASHLYDHHGHFEQLSLVSKLFLSITNRLQVRLKVNNPSVEVLSRQILRFPYLKRIDLTYFRGDLDEALVAISQSQLDLEELDISYKKNPHVMTLKELGSKMKNIKVFRCSYSYLTDDDLVVLSDCFKSVEELDISQQYTQSITDEGIVALSTKLKHLRKINLTGNRKITNHSLISLSTNCVFLTEIELRYCGSLSQSGISFVLRNSPNYQSFILASYVNGPLVLTPLFDYPRHLCRIELCHVSISDEFLSDIANANLPLKHFRLSFCTNFTLDGLSSFLKVYQFLESLALDGTNFLTDESVTHLSHYMRNLISIRLDSCFKLTDSSFVTVALACPFINNMEIYISSSSSSSKELNNTVNSATRSASLTCSTVEGLLHICPNLQFLTVTTLVHSKELDIEHILSHCTKLRHLTINHSGQIIFGEEVEEDFTSKLESLSMKKSWINDRVLEIVGRSCPDLLKLDLEGCMSVTGKGVKALVDNCKNLRYVNLDWCTKVSEEIISWMVASCQSLREIVTPYPSNHHNYEGEASCLLRQGYSAAYEGPSEDLFFYFGIGI